MRIVITNRTSTEVIDFLKPYRGNKESKANWREIFMVIDIGL